MHGTLSDFIYWLNSNVLFLFDVIKIPQKSLFSHPFPCDLIHTFNTRDLMHAFYIFFHLEVYRKIMPLLFLRLKSLRELFVFHGLRYLLKYKINIFFFNVQDIKSNYWIIYLKSFPIIYFCGITCFFPVILICKWFNIWNFFWIPFNFSII